MPRQSKYTITIDFTEQERDMFVEWQNLLGFTSQRQTVEFFTKTGMLAAEMLAGNEIDATSFASALFTIISRFIHAEIESSSVKETIRRFETWQSMKSEPTFMPIKKLTPQ